MPFDPDASLRLFFGLKLTDEVRPQVVDLQQRLRGTGAKVKWVEPENLHFTLKFLGDMPAIMTRDLKQIGKSVAAQLHPWQINLYGLAAFPKVSQPQTIYVGVQDGAEQLTRLARKLSRALVDAALIEEEKKPFIAHCTLGRTKQERGLGELIAALEAQAEFAAGPMTCRQFALLSSQLTEHDPVYVEIASFVFSAGDAAAPAAAPQPESPA